MALLPPLLGALLLSLLAILLGHVPLLAGWRLLLDLSAFGAVFGALVGLAWDWRRRRPPSRGVLAASAIAGLAGALHFALAPSQPAAIVLVVDCLRADRFDADRTPTLYALSADAFRFESARAQSSWTRSSMPSLLSGRVPAEHGLYSFKPPPDVIKPDVRLMAQYFKDAGWATAAFAEQAQLDPAFGYARGFDRYGFHDGWATRLGSRFLWWHTFFRHVPRFVLLHYLDIHGPYTPSRRFKPKGLPKLSFPAKPSTRWRATIRSIRAGEIVPTAEEFSALSALYDGEIRQLDATIHDVTRRLQADGTLDSAWLVVTADHGERFGEHGDVEHMRAPQEVVIRVPLAIRPPGGVDGGRTIASPVSHVDVLPTLLAGLGLGAPEMAAGRDLSPLLRGETLPERPHFAEEWFASTHYASVSWQGWKLLRDRGVHLYDLSSDPAELVDLATENPEKIAELQGMLATYFATVAAGRPLAGVDWEAAGRSGEVWVQTERATKEETAEATDGTLSPGTLSPETMDALEALGYVDEE